MEQAKKQEIKARMKANQHELFVISFEEMDKFIEHSRSPQKRKIKSDWEKYKGKVEAGANYTPYAKDTLSLTKIFSDLGVTTFKAYTKNYAGKEHIIFKGFAGQRTFFTGVKYSTTNPKMIAMGLGKVNAIGNAKAGGLLSIVIMSGYRIADYVLRDQATLSQLIGGLATDVVKIGIATGASIAFVSGAAALTGLATVAVGPIVAAIVVGVGVTWILNTLDEKYGITEAVISAMDEMQTNLERNIDEAKKDVFDIAGEVVGSVIDYSIESGQRIIINWAKDSFKRFQPLQR